MAEPKEPKYKLYYSIGEVAEMLGVNDTLLRFWEREFPQISPKKGGRGVRQYTKDDIETIKVIYNLVKVRGLRIEAAREALRKNKEGAVCRSHRATSLHSLRTCGTQSCTRRFGITPLPTATHALPPTILLTSDC